MGRGNYLPRQARQQRAFFFCVVAGMVKAYLKVKNKLPNGIALLITVW